MEQIFVEKRTFKTNFEKKCSFIKILDKLTILKEQHFDFIVAERGEKEDTAS